MQKPDEVTRFDGSDTDQLNVDTDPDHAFYAESPSSPSPSSNREQWPIDL